MKLLAVPDFRNSFYDGIFAHVFATLTGGVFLTGFALHLGMSDFMIGILAALPFVVTIFQLPTSRLIQKNGTRKKVAYVSSWVARGLWVPVLGFGLLPFSDNTVKHTTVLGLIFLSHAFATVGYIAWLSWTSDLVPCDIRGRFFGTRNMLCGAAGIAATILFGNFLDFSKSQALGPSFGFTITFSSAVIFGLMSLRFLRRVSEAPISPSRDDISFRRNLALPFKDANFRRFLVFMSMWNCAVYLASPFFTLYFLRDLQFSYGFVAALAMVSALADLLGMHVWGKVSDKVKNKVVIRIASWVVVFLPLAWATVRPGSLVIPIVLHLMGGAFWAGINLCTNNLLLAVSPQKTRPLYISAYNIIGGLGAVLGPVVAGLALESFDGHQFNVFSRNLVPLQVVFFASTLLRFLSLWMLRYVHEPDEVSIGQMVRIIRSVRGLNTANGYNQLLHPTIEVPKNPMKRPGPHHVEQEQGGP